MLNRIHPQFNLQSREHQLINQDNYTDRILQAYMENCGAYSPSSILNPKYIRILDTTLRDGEQAAGASMSAAQKLSIARQLALLHVDIIEAGFPASSREDLDAVKAVADEIGARVDERGYAPVIAAVARCSKRDVDAAWEAVKGARRPRICTFLATSEVHMKHKLNMGREDVLAKAADMVRYATRLGCSDVTFAAEDATRSDREFLYRVLEEVIKAGATTVIIPDTVGYTLPSEYRQLILDIKSNTKGIENVIIASHCHNDIGLATANTLAGAEGGARQLEVTINGIGERAGNAGLEEVVMALKCRKELLGGLYTGISTKYIYPISKMVEEYSGLHVQPHKAIVGANAFAHESGIHQDGILKFRGTYEIISPEDIGLLQSDGNGIILGRLSGRHAIKAKLLKLGYNLNEQEFDDVFRKFKEVVKNKKHITDGDIESLITTNTTDTEPIWTLSNFQITHGNIGYSTATVELKDLDMKERTATSVGDGPVDACYKAINSILQVPVTLVEYENSTILGKKLLTSTRVVISERKTDSATFSGKGDDVDIIVSSIKAYLSALNKMLNYK